MSAMVRTLVRALTLLLVAATLAVGLAGPASAAGNAPSVADAGELEGTITTSDGLDFTGTLTVYWWSDDSEFEFWDATSFDGAASGSTYSFLDVADHDFYVEFTDESDTYADAFGNGAAVRPTAPTDPGVVHVSPTQGATANVTLAPLPPKQHVTGNVEDTDGAPLADISVEAIRNFGEHDSAATGSTDEGGAYGLDLRPGSYELIFSETSGAHSDTSTTIQVGNGPLTVDPVVMVPSASSVTFQGRITGANGQGLGHAKVWLVELLGDPGHFHTDVWRDEPILAGPQGYYTITGVDRDAYYTVAASGYMHKRGFVDGAPDALHAGAFYADANQTGVNVQLTERTTGVRGQVTSPYGPVAGIEVQAYLWLPEETVPFFDVYTTAITDEDGNYAIDELPSGDYALRFNADDAAAPVRTAWLGHDDDIVPTSPSGPGVFHVAAATPQDVDGDKVLQAAQVATGVLETAAGAPIQGGTITTFVRSGSTLTSYATTTSGSDGSFAAPVPASKTVTFRFAKTGYQTRDLAGTTGATGDLDLGDQVLTAAMSSSTTTTKLARTRIASGKSTNVTVTVKVPGLSAPTGKVKVYDGTKVLKTVTLAAANKGVVVVKLVKPKKGKHKISAQYLGTATVAASTSKVVTLKVT